MKWKRDSEKKDSFFCMRETVDVLVRLMAFLKNCMDGFVACGHLKDGALPHKYNSVLPLVNTDGWNGIAR